MKTDYARRKLKSLLIDLDSYTNEEFEQQMLRIIAGSTGQDVQGDYCIIKTERDALAAQVEACNDALKTLLKSLPWIGGSLQADGQFYYKVAESVFKKAESALAKTPQQCLAEIRAESVKEFAAFLPAYSYGINAELEKEANKYAAKVRKSSNQC